MELSISFGPLEFSGVVLSLEMFVTLASAEFEDLYLNKCQLCCRF
jgi:hypothetical protein